MKTRDDLRKLNQKKLQKSTDSMEDTTQDALKPSSFKEKDTVEDVDVPEVNHIQQIAEKVREQTLAEFQQERDAFQKSLDDLERKRAELEEKIEAEQQEKARLEQQRKVERDTLLRTFYQGGTPLVSATVEDSVATPYIAGGAMARYRSQDLLKEYTRIVEQDCVSYKTITPMGSQVIQKDYRSADQFYKTHRDHILLALQDDLKKSGYLRGALTSAARDNTTPADIPYAFLDIASAEIRQTHHEETIYWQFARRVNDPSINVEQTGRFPRLEFGAYSDDPLAYELGSSVGSLQEVTEALRASSVPIEIKEYGIGKPGTNLRVISVHEVITANNIFDALTAVNTRLGKSYYRFEDLMIRKLLHSTTRGGYVSEGTLVETAGEVTGGGQITQAFLAYLYGYMSALNIPKLSDGCFFLVLPPQSMAVLRKDIIERERFISAPDFEALTQVMLEYHGETNMKRNSGYQGKIEGFHVFLANSHGVGAPGTEGVATETLNGTAVTTRNCYAFGIDAVGVLESMPFTIRQRKENSFGRTTEFIWLAHQGYGGLDIDPLRVGGSSSEQLRVLDIRCADLAV